MRRRYFENPLLLERLGHFVAATSQHQALPECPSLERDARRLSPPNQPCGFHAANRLRSKALPGRTAPVAESVVSSSTMRQVFKIAVCGLAAAPVFSASQGVYRCQVEDKILFQPTPCAGTGLSVREDLQKKQQQQKDQRESCR